ncbi:hypothetical protein GQ44DRAFT_680492 [Phaeosphaeriaceae sp. PMI808]|nr:hypothetical protein GQ44DRAFT_680492 [Phaeosphaeriaceae sp. PMI808]
MDRNSQRRSEQRVALGLMGKALQHEGGSTSAMATKTSPLSNLPAGNLLPLADSALGASTPVILTENAMTSVPKADDKSKLSHQSAVTSVAAEGSSTMATQSPLVAASESSSITPTTFSPPTVTKPEPGSGSNVGLTFITGSTPADFKSKKLMTTVRKKAMEAYLKNSGIMAQPSHQDSRDHAQSPQSSSYYPEGHRLSVTSIGQQSDLDSGYLSGFDAHISQWTRPDIVAVEEAGNPRSGIATAASLDFLAERRRIQNRIAQRNYRQNLRRKLEALEEKTKSEAAGPPIEMDTINDDDTKSNSSENAIDPEVLMYQDADEAVIIKCTCGLPNDHRFIVSCMTCGTWQHITCYYELAQDVVESHECIECVPRELNSHGSSSMKRPVNENWGQNTNSSTVQSAKRSKTVATESSINVTDSTSVSDETVDVRGQQINPMPILISSFPTGNIFNPGPGSSQSRKRRDYLVRPALRPNISPSITPLALPSTFNVNNAYSTSIAETDYTPKLSNSSTLHHAKIAEQVQLNRINVAFQEMQALLPSSQSELVDSFGSFTTQTTSSKATQIEGAIKHIKQLMQQVAEKDRLLKANDEEIKQLKALKDKMYDSLTVPRNNLNKDPTAIIDLQEKNRSADTQSTVLEIGDDIIEDVDSDVMGENYSDENMSGFGSPSSSADSDSEIESASHLRTESDYPKPQKDTSTSSKSKLRKRTKTGCLACRIRRIKCGAERPICANCIKHKRQCGGNSQRILFKGPKYDFEGSSIVPDMAVVETRTKSPVLSSRMQATIEISEFQSNSAMAFAHDPRLDELEKIIMFGKARLSNPIGAYGHVSGMGANNISLEKVNDETVLAEEVDCLKPDVVLEDNEQLEKSKVYPEDVAELALNAPPGANFLIDYKHALADNCNLVQDLLPDSWRWDVEFHSDCWTCTPLEPDIPKYYPLTIAGAPVILPVEYQWPPIGGVNPPPDPRPSASIDCRNGLDMTIVRDIFLTFEGSIGFYVLISGLLQIIVPEEFDTTWASSHLPHKYGGLKVCYIPQTLEATMLPSTIETTKPKPVLNSQTSSLSSMFRQSRPSTVSSNLTLKLNDFIEARPKANHRKEKYSGRIGLKVMKAGNPYLLMSTHIITEAIMAKSHRDTLFGRGRNRFEKLDDDWNMHADIWAGNEKIGTIDKSFDTEAEIYPNGFHHDVTLIKPASPSAVKDIASTVSDLGWLSCGSWSSLRQQTSAVKILGLVENERSAKSVKCSRPSEILVVGEGIFLNQTAAAGNSKSLKDHDMSTWKDLVSRALLYRVYPDFDPPNGHSGVALYADGIRQDGTEGPGIVGFQSFVQRSGHVQSFNMEGPALERRLQLGRVAFYGAFEVPEELKREYTIA